MLYKIFFKPESLAEISRNIAEVFFASVFIEPILSGKINFDILVIGFIFSFMLWLVSLLLVKQ